MFSGILRDPDFRLRQPIQLINHPVDLFIGGVYLCLDIQRFLLLLVEVVLPFGFFGIYSFPC
jgi:hypothetical protein